MLGFLKRMRWAALMAGYVVVTTVCQLFRITLPNGFFLASAQSEKIQVPIMGHRVPCVISGACRREVVNE